MNEFWRQLYEKPSRWLWGVLLLLGLVLLVEQSVGWSKLLAAWHGLTLSEWIGLSLLTAASYIVRAIRVYDYSYDLLRGAFLTTLRLSVIHNMLNNLLPMRLGEAAYPILMKRYFGQQMIASGVQLLWIRLFDLHVLGMIALIALFTIWDALLVTLFLSCWILGMVTLFSFRKPLLNTLSSKTHFRILSTILGGIPDNTLLAIRIYGWTLLTWALKFIAFAYVLLHFAPLPIYQALFGVIGAELSSVLPFHGVAGAGSYEAAMAAVLIPLGASLDDVVIGAVNMHLYLLLMTVILGLLALLIPIKKRE